MQIDFTIQIWKEGEQFIAHALPIDIASSGPTPELARQALDEAVSLFLRTAFENGTIQEVLEDAGYVLEAGSWRSPSWIGVERRSAVIAA